MATRAHSRRTSLLPLAGAHPPLLPAGSGKQPGPVTLALAAMHAADPDRMRALRQRIADRIEADIALLDALDGDDEREADFTAYAHDGLTLVGHSSDDEPSLCGTSVSWPTLQAGVPRSASTQEPASPPIEKVGSRLARNEPTTQPSEQISHAGSIPGEGKDKIESA